MSSSGKVFDLGLCIWFFGCTASVLFTLVGLVGKNELMVGILGFSIAGANLMIAGIGLKIIFDK